MHTEHRERRGEGHECWGPVSDTKGPKAGGAGAGGKVRGRVGELTQGRKDAGDRDGGEQRGEAEEGGQRRGVVRRDRGSPYSEMHGQGRAGNTEQAAEWGAALRSKGVQGGVAGRGGNGDGAEGTGLRGRLRRKLRAGESRLAASSPAGPPGAQKSAQAA